MKLSRQLSFHITKEELQEAIMDYLKKRVPIVDNGSISRIIVTQDNIARELNDKVDILSFIDVPVV